jgi:hypothetical protein
MLAMLVVGIPIYICATSSTPVAAILILKGISPGAALVFLLAGPATNAATIAVVTKTMGSRSLAIYLSTIAVISIVMGLTLDWIYHAFGISILPSISAAGHILPAWLSHSAAALLIILLARGWYLEKCGTVDHHTISEHVKVEYDPT